ncbi:MAG TPA: isoprenylcysteine carboxylmethyltransferase family protein [Gemmatimonadaceae bacterium]|nr:isoprenylcysteine carboxylmethyltransferase family protein [Gemmatimonadaceae bacterium]
MTDTPAPEPTVLVLLRHLFAIAALPFVVAVVVPVWLARRNNVTLVFGTTAPRILALVAGVCVLAIGLSPFVASVRRFAGDGKGTLAPWDPPRELVASGPYCYVRNPMISGVVFTLFGEAIVLASPAHASWALIFFVANAIYIPLLEEPQLQQRFGASYLQYCANVPRLIPRLTPWIGH